MQSRTTYSLAATLLLTFAACARQEDPDLDYMDEEPMDEGGSSSGGGTSKAGSTSTGKSGSNSTGTGGSTTLPPAGSVGGKGGSKNTGGSKATGGSGGSSGSAGSGGSGGGGDDEPINDPVEGLTVTFKAGEGATADFLGGELFVTNESSESFALDNIKIRYYFTNELNSPPMFIWQWGQFGPTNNLGGITCTGTVVEMTKTVAGANFYVELSCPGGDFASGNQLRTSWKAGNQGNGKLTQDDDWSYVPDGEAPKVVVLDGNTIIWGVEPS